MSSGALGQDPPVMGLGEALAGLAGAAPADAEADFGLRVLRRVGIPRDRYDTYLRVELPTGGLYLASTGAGICHAAPAGAFAAPADFEQRHHARTGRTAIASSEPPPGLLTALRTGRTKRVPLDTAPLPVPQRAVLAAIRHVPRGQLRPVGWVLREAGLDDPGTVLAALAADPVPVLVPTHRITSDDSVPCDLGPYPGFGAELRAAEGIDMDRMAGFAGAGPRLLGSDTTRIFCHPTCAHARRITTAHQVPFRSAVEARDAGYRACKSCRPVAA